MAVPNLWRTKKQRYSLQADICQTCAHTVFPPREVCPRCHQPMHSEQPAGECTGGHGFILPALLPLPQAPPVAAGDD